MSQIPINYIFVTKCGGFSEKRIPGNVEHNFDMVASRDAVATFWCANGRGMPRKNFRELCWAVLGLVLRNYHDVAQQNNLAGEICIAANISN